MSASAGSGFFLQQMHRRKNHSWGTDAALRTATFQKRFLQGIHNLPESPSS